MLPHIGKWKIVMSTNTATPWCKSMEAKHFPFRKSGLTAAEDLWSIEINRMCCSSFAAENKQQPAEIPLSLIWCETGFLEEIIKVDSKNKINVGCTRISKIPTKYCWDHIKVLHLFSFQEERQGLGGLQWMRCCKSCYHFERKIARVAKFIFDLANAFYMAFPVAAADF